MPSMNFDLNDLLDFRAVAELNSFRRAAELNPECADTALHNPEGALQQPWRPAKRRGLSLPQGIPTYLLG